MDKDSEVVNTWFDDEISLTLGGEGHCAYIKVMEKYYDNATACMTRDDVDALIARLMEIRNRMVVA